MKKRILIPAAFIVVAAAAILFYFLWQNNSIIGTVGNEKVTKAEYIVFFRAQANLFLSENQIFGTTEKEEFWKEEIDGKSTKDIVKERTASKLTEFKIQLKRAKETGVKLDKRDLKDVEDYMEQLMDSASVSENKGEREKDFVKMFGVSSKEYEEVYKKVKLVRKLVLDEVDAIELSEDEIHEYYEKNKDYIDNFTIRDILVATMDLTTGELMSEEEMINAGNKAFQALQKLEGAKDADDIAIEYSDDPNVRKNKGLFTFKIPMDRQNEIERWTLGSKPGDTGVVQDYNGYHVLKLEKRSSYEEVKQDAAQMLAEEKYLQILAGQRDDPANEFKIKDKEFIDSMDFSF